MTVQYLTVEANYSNQRIDNFLFSRLKGLPKSRLYKALRKGEVRVNKKRISPEYRLQENDIVRIPPFRLGETKEKSAISTALKTTLEQSIIASSDDFFIIDKPAHLAVHGGTGITVDLIDALGQMLGKTEPLQLAHRLDKATSGCLVVARNLPFLRYFQQQMQKNRVEKHYQALVKGHWPENQRTIDAPLRRTLLQGHERRVQVDTIENGAKIAITHFTPITYGKRATLIDAKLVTGRTHQIRVHAAHCGHPIIGDDKYGDKTTNQHFSRLGLKRIALHARRIAFYLPNGQHQCYESPTPSLFIESIQ